MNVKIHEVKGGVKLQTIEHGKPFYIPSKYGRSIFVKLLGQTRGPIGTEETPVVVLGDQDKTDTKGSFITAGTIVWLSSNERVFPLQQIQCAEFRQI